MAEDEGRFIGTADAAEILHVSTRTVQRKADTGQIPVVQTLGPHRSLVFERAEIERLAREEKEALGQS